MNKLAFLSVVLLLAALMLGCGAPTSTSAPAPADKPVDTTTLQAGEPFAGEVTVDAATITWYALKDLPATVNFTVASRADSGIDLRVAGRAMPVWKDGGSWSMSDGVNGHVVDFAAGKIGHAGFKGGTIAYVRQVNGEWQVGVSK